MNKQIKIRIYDYETRDEINMNMNMLIHSKAGFLAEGAPSTASVELSGFFRLIRWLISRGFPDSDDVPLFALDEPAPFDDDDDAPASGFGFINLAISRFTSSMDCKYKKKS